MFGQYVIIIDQKLGTRISVPSEWPACAQSLLLTLAMKIIERFDYTSPIVRVNNVPTRLIRNNVPDGIHYIFDKVAEEKIVGAYIYDIIVSENEEDIRLEITSGSTLDIVSSSNSTSCILTHTTQIDDSPLFSKYSPPLCLGCYCPVQATLCSRCGWPVCGAECEAAAAHAPECAVFAAARVRFQPVDDWTASAPQLDCITPLRVLLAKEKEPERWARELEPMEAHTAARQARPTWGADQVNVATFLVEHCRLGARFDKELVQRVCGILEVNAVEIPSRGGFSIRAVYPKLAIAAHSCVPNIVHTILQNDYEVQVRAAVPIKSGEPLHLCYTHVLSPTITRRDYLLESKFFSCDCKRCADPTELGSHLSTLKCSKCDNGVILCTNPLDREAGWQCTDKNCGFKTSSAAMMKMLAVVQAEIDQLDALEPGTQAVEQREATLKKYKSVFHPRHALLLSLKQALAQLYGRVEGYAIDELPDLLLERKAELCRLVLAALDAVAPGETRMRGMMLYELHAPLMFLARSEFSAGLITQEKLKERLQEPIKCLEEASKILMREDPQSPEGISGQIAYQSMEQLKASLDAL